MRRYLLHVRRSGNGPTIVLLHGLAGSGSFWEPIVPILSQKYEVVRLDLLGYGHSPKPMIKYTAEVHIQAVHDTLMSQDITDPFAVVGLSMGALLGLDYIARYQQGITKFVGVGLPYYSDKTEARKYIGSDRWARLVLNHRVLGETWLDMLWLIGRHNKTVRRIVSPAYYTDEMTRESLMNPPRVLRSCIVSTMFKSFAPDLLDINTDKDILLIHGADDQWSPATAVQKVADDYPNVSIKILDNVAHNTALIAPEKTAAAIMNFLANTSG
jgi:pimeloyl-ACP methyl ester carboxylesterase